MPKAFSPRNLLDPALLIFLAIFATIRAVSTDNTLLVYALSYAFHLVNLQAFLGRRYPLDDFIRHSILLRTVAVGTLAMLLAPYLVRSMEFWGLAPIAAGLALQVTALRALGLERTYYAVELGQAPPRQVARFPYDRMSHPMAIGTLFQLIGIEVLSPEFASDYPVLVPGHVLLTALTAVVEHLGWHVRAPFYGASRGTFSRPAVRRTIDRLREWALARFSRHLHVESSMHRYVRTLPPDVVAQINEVRYSSEVLNPIRTRFPRARIVPLPQTDEICISRFDHSGGRDQGLFEWHDDGDLRNLPGATVVRSLVCLSAEDELEVRFETSGRQWNMRTYDFGLIDFHRELHTVQGNTDATRPARLLLKCNYYVDLVGFAPYRWLGIFLNVVAFYIVKASMEYGKSPETVTQRVVGVTCNVFRRLNHFNPVAPVLLVLWLGLSIGVFVAQVAKLL